MWRDSLLCVVRLGKQVKGERVWGLGLVKLSVGVEGELGRDESVVWCSVIPTPKRVVGSESREIRRSVGEGSQAQSSSVETPTSLQSGVGESGRRPLRLTSTMKEKCLRACVSQNV